MTTWANLDSRVQHLVDDTAQTYWTIGSSGSIRKEIESAELLIALFRGLSEDTVDISLTSGTAEYRILDTATDFILPFRATISNVPMRKVAFSSLIRLDPNYRVTQSTPEMWYSLGSARMGVYPVPNGSFTMKLTYLRVPPTAQSSGSPVIGEEWHDTLAEYAAAILKASEGRVEEGVDLLKTFLSNLGIRLPRFLRGAAQKEASSTATPFYNQTD